MKKIIIYLIIGLLFIIPIYALSPQQFINIDSKYMIESLKPQYSNYVFFNGKIHFYYYINTYTKYYNEKNDLEINIIRKKINIVMDYNKYSSCIKRLETKSCVNYFITDTKNVNSLQSQFNNKISTEIRNIIFMQSETRNYLNNLDSNKENIDYENIISQIRSD